MDPTNVWTELAKAGLLPLLEAVVIWYLVGQLKDERSETRRVQEARLGETKEYQGLYNQAIKQIDTTTQLIGATPKALADFQEKVTDAMGDLTKTVESLQRDIKK